MSSAPGRSWQSVLLIAAAVLVLLGAGCAPSPGADPVPAASAAGSTPVIAVREGHPARASTAFVPRRIELPGRESAAVLPAATVDGVLQVPTDVRRVGWWDGSAEVNDPFGSTVIAGHVDSATQGLGFFSRLLSLQRGDVVTVSAGSAERARYQITSVRPVAKGALSADSAAFDQTGGHRLVLITCTGAYLPDRGGYQNNLVILARPL